MHRRRNDYAAQYGSKIIPKKPDEPTNSNAWQRFCDNERARLTCPHSTLTANQNWLTYLEEEYKERLRLCKD